MARSTAPACSCDATQEQTWGKRSWFLAGFGTFVAGLLLFWVVLPVPLGPALILGGAVLMLASPVLPTRSRCARCGEPARTTG